MTSKIIDNFKHDPSFAVRLFSVANNASFVQKKLGFRIRASSVSVMVRNKVRG